MSLDCLSAIKHQMCYIILVRLQSLQEHTKTSFATLGFEWIEYDGGMICYDGPTVGETIARSASMRINFISSSVNERMHNWLPSYWLIIESEPIWLLMNGISVASMRDKQYSTHIEMNLLFDIICLQGWHHTASWFCLEKSFSSDLVLGRYWAKNLCKWICEWVNERHTLGMTSFHARLVFFD